VVAISAIDPATGDPLLTHSSRASSRSAVITELDKLARQLRRDLGEPILSLVQNTVPLDRATTPSLEALQAYSQGRRAFNEQRPDDALPLYLRAVELDSNFAMAHAGLAFYYYYVRNDRIRGDEHYQKALSLSDRLTDLERISIRADGAFAQQNFEEAASAYRIYTTRYPDDGAAWNNLGLSYMRLRQYEQAIETLHEAIARDSTNRSAQVNLAASFGSANQPDSALKYYEMTFDRFPDLRVFANLNHEYGFTLVNAGHPDSARAVFAEMFAGTRSDQARGHRSLALLDMYQGRYHDAIPRLREALVLNRADDELTSELRNLTYLASAYRILGQSEELASTLARARDIAWRPSIGPFWLATLMKLYLRSGMPEQGIEVGDSILARVDSTIRFDQTTIHLTNGELLLAKHGCADALSDLELAYALNRTNDVLESIAYCHLVASDWDRAATRFEELIAKPSLGWEAQEDWILAHYYLGTIREAQGDTAAAINQYNRFLEIWAEADRDIPILMDARERLLNLSGLR
jgi:eukaryotic-like serine/threonine-protein kinase